MAPNTIDKRSRPVEGISDESIASYKLNNLSDDKSDKLHQTISGSLIVINGPQASSLSVDNERTRSSGRVTLPLALGATLAMLLGSIPSGYNVGVVNTPQMVLKSFCNKTLNERGIPISSENLDLLWSVCVSTLLFAAIVATNFSNQLANWSGRKGALLISGLFGIIGSILFFGSHYLRNVETLILARFVSGIHSGFTSGLVPLYIAEIAPESLKGSMGVLHSTGLNFGMLLGQILGQETLLGTDKLWSLLLALSAIFIVIGMFLYKSSPSSPVYLYIMKKKYSKAAKELAHLRRCSVSQIEDEIVTLRKEQKEQEANKSNWTFLSVLAIPEYRGKVLLVILVHVGQQFSGINAVFYYSTATFYDLGMTMQQAQYGSIALGMVNAVTCFIAMPLLKKWRRRTLLFLSIWGGVFCLIGLTVTIKIKESYSWAPIATIALFLLFAFIFALGNGAIPWLLPSELLPQATLGAVMGIGGLINWLGNFAVALSFPVLDGLLGDSVFLIYAVFSIFEGIVLFFYLPETNSVNKSTSTEVILPSASTITTPTTLSTPTSPTSKPTNFEIESDHLDIIDDDNDICNKQITSNDMC